MSDDRAGVADDEQDSLDQAILSADQREALVLLGRAKAKRDEAKRATKASQALTKQAIHAGISVGISVVDLAPMLGMTRQGVYNAMRSTSGSGKDQVK